MDRLVNIILVIFALAILGLSLYIVLRPEPVLPVPVEDNLEHLEGVKNQIDSILYELKKRDNETIINNYISTIDKVGAVTDNDSILWLVDRSIRVLDSIDKIGWDRLYRHQD